MNIQRGVIVALTNEETAQKVRNILCEDGYDVLAICTTGGDLIRRAMQLSPELIVTGYKLSDMTLLDIYDSLGDQCSFLAVLNETYRSFIDEDSDIYCINSPISRAGLLNAVDLIFQSRMKLIRLQQKVEKLEDKIEERIVIDKAKGVLMMHKGFSEMESFRYIQKTSMNSGQKMSEVAEKIIFAFSDKK